MKSILPLLLAVFAFAQVAAASTEDAADPSSANLVNLNYYLRPGLVRLTPSMASAVNYFAGNTSYSNTQYSLFAEYGLPIDGLRISISETDSLFAGQYSQNSFFSSGLGDPTIQINYRILDSTPSGWSFDAQIDVLPEIGTRYVGTSANPGTNAAGYTNLAATAAAYWRVAINETRFAANAAYRSTGSGTNVSRSDSDFDTTDEWIGSVAVTDRVHLCPRFYVQGAADFIFGHSLTTDFASGTGITTTTPFHVEPQIVMGFLPTHQTLLQANVHYAGYDEDQNGPITIRDTTYGLSLTVEF